MLQPTYIIIFLILSLTNLALTKKSRNSNTIIEIFALYALLIFVGLTGIVAAVGHLFFADQVAKSIGWIPGNGFQSEIGMTNLAFGILGILCIWFRKNFWLATAIGSSIFLLGAAGVHIHDIIVYHNMAPNNAGAVLYLGDILLPILTLILVIISNRKIQNS